MTHQKNHAETQSIRADILSFPPEKLGPVDVLIGSPPCTEFSFANRGGSGDVEEGLRLVYRFLRFVYELEPRWWVMENVPRVLDFLPEEVPLRKLGIDKKGSLPIPRREVLRSADYGAPQLRRRSFSGDFPSPQPTHGESKWRTLRDVVRTLPDPLKPPNGVARDPVYGFEISASELTDHFSVDLVLEAEEVRENRKTKEDHSWYGRMSFPDELDRPARTIMATNLRVSRETTIIDSGDGRFRQLSVREASSVQGFPITYQWWAGSSSLKYKLVGNAVAPPVAFAIASQIRRSANFEVPRAPWVIRTVLDKAPAPQGHRRRRPLPLNRRFREHIPGSKVPGFRVDIDNRGRTHGDELVRWRTVLYRGSGKTLRQDERGLADALEMLERTVADPATRRRVIAYLTDLRGTFEPIVPSARELQEIRAERAKGDTTPYALVECVGELVARHFGTESRVVRFHSPRDPNYVPLRIAATLVAATYVCALANEHPVHPRLSLRVDAAASKPRTAAVR